MFDFILSNKLYDVMKYTAQALPLLLTFIGVVMKTLGYDPSVVLTIGTAFVTLLEGLLSISNKNYKRIDGDK